MNTPNDYKVPDWNEKCGPGDWKESIPAGVRDEWTAFTEWQQMLLAEWAILSTCRQVPIPADPPIATVAALARMGKLRIRTVPGWLYRTSLELPRPAPTDTWFYNDGDCCWERSHWGGKERDTARNNGRVYRYPADPDFEMPPPEAEEEKQGGEYMVLDGNCENIPLTDDERQAATYPTIEAAEAAVIAEIEPDPGAFEGWGDDDSFSDSFAIVRIVRRVLPVLTVSLAVRLEEQA